MRRAALFVISVLMAATLRAHPGIGIVVDSRGSVFYTDLRQVWRLAPSGQLSIAVPAVHTHELMLDAKDNLYGEHLWYEGDATKKWQHYFWRRTPDGVVEVFAPTHEAFRAPERFTLVRDRAGNMYDADREHNNAIVKIAPDGKRLVIARGNFRDIRWMAASPEGTVYFIDSTDLLRVAPDGRVTTLARNLSRRRLIRPDIGEHHLVMGLWSDRRGNVYVADYAGGLVKQVAASGRVTVVAESHLPWSVTGGTFAPNGDLWLLEYRVGVGDTARARRAQR